MTSILNQQEQHQVSAYTRRCQECGHRQEAKDPKTYNNDSWRDIKCRKCKSIGLDYGSGDWLKMADGKLVQKSQMEVYMDKTAAFNLDDGKP